MVDGNIEYILTLLPYIIEKVMDVLKKEKLKKELGEIIRGSLEKLSGSLGHIMDDYSNVLGTFVLGATNIYSPFIKPKEKAEELVSKLEDSYNNLMTDMKEFIRLVKTHEDEFKAVLGREERLIIEAFIEAFEKEQPDWKFLFNHATIKKFMRKRANNKDKPLLDALSNEMKELNKRLGIEWIANENLKKIYRSALGPAKKYKRTF